MKKLVTAACALVAGLALADGIESANIVGYQDVKNLDAEEGYNLICPVFTSVGKNTVRLGDISLLGDDVALRQDNIQIFDATGNAEYQFQWRQSGWYDVDEKEYVNDTVIDRAQGVILDSYNGGISIRSVGEVATSDAEVTGCVEGYNVVGNPFPVDLTLASVSLTGDDVALRQDNIQIFDASGNAEYQFQWRQSGWYDVDEKEYVNDTVFPAGLGVVVDCYNGGDVTVNVAAPSMLAN